MPLTVSDVRSTAFRVVLRGYSVEEVDAFCDRVEEELGRREDGGPPAPGPEPAAGAGTPPATTATTPEGAVGEGGTAARGVRLLAMAEATAERLLAEARQEADATRAEADADARRLRAEADADARRLRAEAEQAAADHLAAARTEAEEVLRSARGEADALRGELAERRERHLAGLEARCGELAAEVAALERAEVEHRERMVALLSEQLQVVQPGRLRAVT